MITTRTARRCSIAFVLCAALVSSSIAKPPRDDPPPSPQPVAPPAVATVIAPQISKLEDDIAQLAQKRSDTAPAALPWLEMQIDCRILARWLLNQTQSARELGSMQAGGYLHSNSMLALLPIVDDFVSKQTAVPSAVQQVGTERLHQLTFQLKDAKDLAAIDSLCADTAQDILIATTTVGAGEQLPALIPMRPAANSTSQPADVAASDQHGPPTIENLVEAARQASVSAQLRKQLIATAAMAQEAQTDTAHPLEAQALQKELADAIDLTKGLQSNTGVTADERTQIESQLSDGLALFADSRTRSIGQGRLAALDQYRQLLGRVAQMRIPPELKDALSPAVSWAHEHPDQGDKVLAAIERFLALYARQQARPQEPTEFAALRPSDPLRRAYDDAAKQFTKERGDFLGDLSDLGGTSALGSGTGQDSLAEPVDKMAALQHLLDVLVEMPKTFSTLNAFKPRPSGGIERRMNSLLITIGSPIKSPARDEATKQLQFLHSLGSVASDLSARSSIDVPAAVAQTYAGNELAAAQTKWAATVTEQASAFAANQPTDSAKVDRLKALRDLLDALPLAGELEAAFAKTDALAKWADWSLNADGVHALLTPYQQAMSQGFAGFVADSPDASADFLKMRPHFEPMMRLLIRTAGYAPACEPLPDGTVGLLSRLATPYDKAPFATQRFASLVAALNSAGNNDPAIALSAATAISDHLRQ